MTFAPKSGFPFDPLRAPEDKPASNLYTGIFGNSRIVAETDSPFAPVKNVDSLVSEIQELCSADEFNFDLTVNFVAQRVLDFFGGSGVAIAMEQGSRILCCASAGETAPDVGTALNVASGISGVCFRSGQSQYCHDARRDERVDFESCQALGILSILISPVLVDGRTVGLVEVFSPEEFFFDKTDILSLERLASLVAQAHMRKIALFREDQNIQASKAMAAAAAIAPTLTPSFVAELLSAASAPKAAASSPTIAYSPSLPANSVVSTSSLSSPVSAELPVTVHRPTARPMRDSKQAAGRSYKSLLLAVCVLALLVAAGLGTRVLLRERSDAQALPTTAPTTSAISQPAAPTITTPNNAARSTAAGAAGASSLLPTSKPADKKPVSTEAAALQSNSTTSRSIQVMDLLAPNRKASAIPQRKPNAAEAPPEAPSLSSVSTNKSQVNLAASISAGAGSAPRVNHTPVIEQETLIRKVTPTYPAMARSAHVNGEVVVRLMIGKDGNVKNPVIEKGPQMLRGAVLDAVKQWKYKPYRVDGDPREIEAVVSVKFQ